MDMKTTSIEEISILLTRLTGLTLIDLIVEIKEKNVEKAKELHHKNIIKMVSHINETTFY